MRKIDQFVIKYIKINDEISKLKKELNQYRKQIENYLYKKNLGKLVVVDPDDDENKIECKYKRRKQKKINYTLLAEYVSDLEKYNQIVEQKENTSLFIRKVKNKKENKIPEVVKNQSSIELPIGELS